MVADNQCAPAHHRTSFVTKNFCYQQLSQPIINHFLSTNQEPLNCSLPLFFNPIYTGFFLELKYRGCVWHTQYRFLSETAIIPIFVFNVNSIFTLPKKNIFG